MNHTEFGFPRHWERMQSDPPQVNSANSNHRRFTNIKAPEARDREGKEINDNSEGDEFSEGNMF